ncbi:MAG: Serine acetyltransferase-like protein [Betaproteobacteria bacterium]|nr:Serine acetyltransferase-like protein [Betaproteobacteria bacterium]
MTEREKIFVFGASGHAKVVIDMIEREGRREIAWICDDALDKHGKQLMGYEILGGREALLARRGDTVAGVVAIGDNRIRLDIAAWLADKGYRLAPVVHPAAAIGREVEIGDGTVVMAGCVINSGTRVGRHAIVNTGATVDHDCILGDGVHVGPGSQLCGHVTVGASSLVGAGTTIVPSVRVGANVVVGAGSTVLADVPDGARVGGSPCRPLGS